MNSSLRVTSVITAIVASLIALASLASCAGEATKAAPAPATAQVRGSRFSLRLEPGPSYKFMSSWLIFPMPIYPQVACWIETPGGDYVDTIYATAKGARKQWLSAPANGRPEALPVWFGIQQGRRATADAISGATPSGATMRDSSLAASLKAGTYVVKLEINRSYDYNERYTRANSGVAGQPSLVYACEIAVGSGSGKAVLAPVGTGAVDGSDGDIRPGLDGITTALQLLSVAEISYEAGEPR